MSYDSEPSSPDIQGTGTALSQRHWKDAETARNCNVCGLEFKMLVRKKHHCRHCGEVVCHECCKAQYVLEDFGGTRGKMRVCSVCADKYESDKEHPLYAMLGARLGEQYFYTFMKNGDDDVAQICELLQNRELLEVMFERNRVAKSNRAAIADRIKKASAVADSNGDGPITVAHMMKEKAALEKQLKEKRAEYKQATQQQIEVIELRNELATLKAQQRFEERTREELQKRGERAVARAAEDTQMRKRAYEMKAHDQPACEICDAPLKVRGRHHCRFCYRCVCGSCSTAKVDDSRICDWCHINSTLETKAWMHVVSSSSSFRHLWIARLEKLMTDMKAIDSGHQNTGS